MANNEGLFLVNAAGPLQIIGLRSLEQLRDPGEGAWQILLWISHVLIEVTLIFQIQPHVHSQPKRVKECYSLCAWEKSREYLGKQHCYIHSKM